MPKLEELKSELIKAQESNDINLQLSILVDICRQQPYRGERLEFRETLAEMEELVVKHPESEDKFKAIIAIYRADLLADEGKAIEAFEKFNLAMTYESSLDLRSKASLHNKFGMLFMDMNMMDQAITRFTHVSGLMFEAMKEQPEDEILLAHYFSANVNMGNCYAYLKEFDKAIGKYKDTLDQTSKLENLNQPHMLEKKAISVSNIIEACLSKDDLATAEEYFPLFESLLYEKEGEVYKPMYHVAFADMLKRKNDLQGAKENFEIALGFKETLDHKRRVNLRYQLAKIEEELGNESIAIELMEEVLDEARNSSQGGEEIKALEFLIEKYRQAGRTDEIVKLYERAYELRTQLSEQKINRSLLNFEVMQAEKLKEKEIEIERLKNVELRNALDALKEAQDELVKSERMAAIGNIAQEIAHEVQNPLNFINNFSDVNRELIEEVEAMLSDELKKDDLKELIEQLKSNSQIINGHGNEWQRL